MDITGQVFSVKQEVVADNVERQSSAPVGDWVIGRGSGTSSTPCRRVTTAWLLLLGFFFLALREHRQEEFYSQLTCQISNLISINNKVKASIF